LIRTQWLFSKKNTFVVKFIIIIIQLITATAALESLFFVLLEDYETWLS